MSVNEGRKECWKRKWKECKVKDRSIEKMERREEGKKMWKCDMWGKMERMLIKKVEDRRKEK